MPGGNNANGIVTLNTHDGDYYHQLGFTNKGIYCRFFDDYPVSDDIGWDKIIRSNDFKFENGVLDIYLF